MCWYEKYCQKNSPVVEVRQCWGVTVLLLLIHNPTGHCYYLSVVPTELLQNRGKWILSWFLHLGPEEGSEENLKQLIPLSPTTIQTSKLGINTGGEQGLADNLQNKKFNEDSKAEETSVKI